MTTAPVVEHSLPWYSDRAMNQRFRLWFIFLIAFFLPLLIAKQEKPSIPVWTLYLDHHVGITIPLKEEGKPFTVEGSIVDSRNTVVREFKQTTMNGPASVLAVPAHADSLDHPVLLLRAIAAGSRESPREPFL